MLKAWSAWPVRRDRWRGECCCSWNE